MKSTSKSQHPGGLELVPALHHPSTCMSRTQARRQSPFLMRLVLQLLATLTLSMAGECLDTNRPFLRNFEAFS